MTPRTILLIRAEEPAWDALRAVLSTLPAVEIVGEATTEGQARCLVGARQPDVILAAAHLAGTSTLPLLRDLHCHCAPLSRIIVFAACCPDPNDLLALAELNARGCLLWDDLSAATLRIALLAIIAGDLVVSSSAAVTTFLAAQHRSLRPNGPWVHVTAREQALLEHLADGMTYEQVAHLEELSLRTVEHAIATLKDKLDAQSQFALGLQAGRLGLLCKERSTQVRHPIDANLPPG
ncbi:MAG TPA: LuxR C-terminal-related transcriptional regulator [Thermomicrobiales bacterium]|nr:LuxR C-terminal-related transcriptional regulator [Thermomicrobiales bacterium]